MPLGKVPLTASSSEPPSGGLTSVIVIDCRVALSPSITVPWGAMSIAPASSVKLVLPVREMELPSISNTDTASSVVAATYKNWLSGETADHQAPCVVVTVSPSASV